MKKEYIKPLVEVSSFTVCENISSEPGLNDWLVEKNLETNAGITTYYLESM